ncbi:hypothetical protein, partial [Nocardia brasiliensis]|uniref:hypothetical protein n=1 Tax=Nocardia brasiliensis TaxID=37326 RepID=UPI002458FAC9
MTVSRCRHRVAIVGVACVGLLLSVCAHPSGGAGGGRGRGGGGGAPARGGGGGGGGELGVGGGRGVDFIC